ncbi:hypothetical protein N9L02_01670 [Gammaproteobacteria bacterium]|nr:hypothetical protein [Gammaproteobacteria bacterium]
MKSRTLLVNALLLQSQNCTVADITRLKNYNWIPLECDTDAYHNKRQLITLENWLFTHFACVSYVRNFGHHEKFILHSCSDKTNPYIASTYISYKQLDIVFIALNSENLDIGYLNAIQEKISANAKIVYIANSDDEKSNLEKILNSNKIINPKIILDNFFEEYSNNFVKEKAAALEAEEKAAALEAVEKAAALALERSKYSYKVKMFFNHPTVKWSLRLVIIPALIASALMFSGGLAAIPVVGPVILGFGIPASLAITSAAFAVVGNFFKGVYSCCFSKNSANGGALKDCQNENNSGSFAKPSQLSNSLIKDRLKVNSDHVYRENVFFNSLPEVELSSTHDLLQPDNKAQAQVNMLCRGGII